MKVEISGDLKPAPNSQYVFQAAAAAAAAATLLLRL